MLSRLPKSKQHDLEAIEKYRFIYNFLPHPIKKERAKLLSHRAVTIYCLILLAMFAFFRLAPKYFPGVLGYASNIKTYDLLELTNKRRESAGLGTLKMNDALSRAAQNKANDMFKKGYWAHVSPSGTEPWDFILAQSYDYSYAGENLAKNFNSSKEVVDAWYNSPSHRENLLNKNYTEMGFAVVNGVLDGYETTLVVQMFGKPRNPNQLASIEPEDEPAPAVEVAAVPQEVKAVSSTTLVPLKTAPIVSSTPVFDITFLSKTVALLFGGYVLSLLILDVWYSKLKNIPKFTGHTFAHFAFLLVALLGMWLVLAPGKIL